MDFRSKQLLLCILFAFLTFNNFAIADETPRINTSLKKNTCSITGSVTIAQVRNYKNPKQHVNGADIYQFADLSASSGLTENDLAEILIGKGVLSGKASIYLEAAEKYHVSEVYLVSHSLLETNNGISPFANGSKQHNGRTVYNMYGIGVFNNNPQNGVKLAYNKGWFSVDEAIDGGARWISENFINKKGISKKYFI